MEGSIDDKVGPETQAEHETGEDYQTKYPVTRFTRAAEKVCEFMDSYIALPFVNTLEYCLDCLSDISIRTGLNILRYHDKHGNIIDKNGNIVDKNGNIVDPAKVTIIGKGKKYKTNKEKPNKENCEGDEKCQ